VEKPKQEQNSKQKQNLHEKDFQVNHLQGILIAALVSAAFAQGQGGTSAPADSAYELEATVIKGSLRPLTSRESDQVAKMPLKNMENPQAYTVVPKELTKQQVAVDHASAFKNIAGAAKDGQYMQGQTFFFSRGFTTTSEVRNGISTNVISDFDPVNLERLEAVRGPAGALYGTDAGVSYGGLFNRVTKVPLAKRQGEVSYSAGSWNLTRITTDFNTPLNDDKTLLFRINIARHLEGSHMDQGFTDAWAIAPSLSYQVSDRLKLSLDVESYRRTGTSVPQFYVSGGTSVSSMKDLNLDYKRSFLDNSLATESRNTNVYAKADFAITPDWSSETILSTTSSASDLESIYSYAFNDSLAERYLDSQNWKVYTRQVQQNFRGTVVTGPLRHQALVGLSASNHSYKWPYTVVFDTVNYVNPGADYFIGHDVYRARVGAAPLNMWTQDNYTYSAYASDAVHFLDRFTVLAGVRWDLFDNRGNSDGLTPAAGDYRQHAISPRVGAVFQPVKDRVALFANYLTGYKNVAGRSVEGTRFDPEHAYQAEGGVKVTAPGGLLTGTLSVYHIQVEDLVRADPDTAGFSIQDGTQRSQGVDVDLASNPIEGLVVLAGYAYNTSKMIEANPDVRGRRPTSAGPEHAANIWVSYEAPRWIVKGLGAGTGGNYVDEIFHANTSAFVFTVPAYVTWDATLFYNQPKYRVAVKVDNILDQHYWSPSNLQSGPTRRVIGDVTYRF
jgi:iron complex outermembrane receptor protein